MATEPPLLGVPPDDGGGGMNTGRVRSFVSAGCSCSWTPQASSKTNAENGAKPWHRRSMGSDMF
jgi:hypothetical protein